ncbi:MAG: redoxin domain-containing protein, partial [Bdellovibrionota bacterium]
MISIRRFWLFGVLLLAATWLRPGYASESLDLRDTDGNYLSVPSAKNEFLVLFFADRTCPVATKYVATLNAIAKKFEKKKIDFLFVFPGDEELWNVARHVNEFKVHPPAFIDSGFALRNRFSPKVLSEVVVLDREMKVRYQGRIDDQFSVGEANATATTHELEDALSALAAGRKVAPDWPVARGCALSVPPAKTTTFTYMSDIRPLIEKRCQSCHHQGGAGPFPLTTYDEVSRMAPAISLVLKEFRMPPWFSDTSPDHFANVSYLPLKERQKILKWIEGGATRGKGIEKIAKKSPVAEWTLGNPDQIIRIPADTVIPASGRGYFQEFAFDPGHKQDLWIDKVEFRPDNVRSIHHITLYTRKKGTEELTEHDSVRWGYFAGYAPGSGPTVFPKGMAKKIPVGYEFLVSAHFVPFAIALFFVHLMV